MNNKNINNGVFFAFVPHRLIVDQRLELKFFPFNILFLKIKEENSKIIKGIALYEPDLSTFKVEDKTFMMTYYNKYGEDNFVIISIFKTKKGFEYNGEKYVDNKMVGSAIGLMSSVDDEKGWGLFFTHLTSLGLSNKECCRFENIK